MTRARLIILCATISATILTILPCVPFAATDPKWLVLAIGVLMLAVTDRGTRSAKTAPTVILLAFVAWQAVCACFSDYPGVSAARVLTWYVLAGLYWQTSRIEPQHERAILTTIVLSACAASLYAIAQALGIDPFPWGGKASPEYLCGPSVFGNPQLAASVCSMALVVAMFVFRRWFIRGPIAGLLAWHVLHTGSRTALVALGVVSILALTMAALRRPPRLWLGFVAVAVYLAVSGAVGYRAVNYDRSVLLRYNAYSGAVNMVYERPMFGYGPGTYERESPPYWTLYERARMQWAPLRNQHVHCDYLEVAVESGVPGAALYLAFWAVVIWRGLQRRGPTRSCALALVAFVVLSAFGFPMYAPASVAVAFVLAGVCVTGKAGES